MTRSVLFIVFAALNLVESLKCRCLTSKALPQNCSFNETLQFCNAEEGKRCVASRVFYHNSNSAEWSMHCAGAATNSTEMSCSEQNTAGYVLRSCTCATEMCNAAGTNDFLKDLAVTSWTTTTVPPQFIPSTEAPITTTKVAPQNAGIVSSVVVVVCMLFA